MKRQRQRARYKDSDRDTDRDSARDLSAPPLTPLSSILDERAAEQNPAQVAQAGAQFLLGRAAELSSESHFSPKMDLR